MLMIGGSMDGEHYLLRHNEQTVEIKGRRKEIYERKRVLPEKEIEVLVLSGYPWQKMLENVIRYLLKERKE